MGPRTWAFPTSWHLALRKSGWDSDGPAWVPALPLRSCLVFSKSLHFSRLPFLHLWSGRGTVGLEWLLQGSARKEPNAALQKEQRRAFAAPRFDSAPSPHRAWRAVGTLVSFPALIADGRLLISTLDGHKAREPSPPSPALTEQALKWWWEKRAD